MLFPVLLLILCACSMGSRRRASFCEGSGPEFNPCLTAAYKKALVFLVISVLHTASWLEIPLKIFVWNYHIFENNLRIELVFKKYLKGSFGLRSDQHFSPKILSEK